MYSKSSSALTWCWQTRRCLQKSGWTTPSILFVGFKMVDFLRDHCCSQVGYEYHSRILNLSYRRYFLYLRNTVLSLSTLKAPLAKLELVISFGLPTSSPAKHLGLPGLGSIFAKSSRWGRRRFRLAGSPVLWRAIVNSWTLCANEAGVCNLKKL